MHQDLIRAFSLDGRVAVLTGAASGIGRQAAITLAQAGARVVLGDVDEAGLAETAARVAAIGGEVVCQRTDVSVRDQIGGLASLAVEKGGRIDVWANIAGLILATPVVDATEAQFDRVLSVNLKGTYWGCAAAARVMISQRSGSIINISSTGADVAAAGLSIYAISKAGVNMLTRTLAVEVGRYGVRANSIAPGFIDTPMVSYRFQTAEGGIDTLQRDAIFEQRARVSPLGLTGEPSDVGYCMLYLACDASRFVTGQVLRPNGGASMP
jgi:3-oxoacyl-[acyl-carrier protein] reductase